MEAQTVLGGAVLKAVSTGTFDGWKDKPSPKGSGNKLAAIVSAFLPTWFTACLFVAAFVMVRRRYPKIYAPRTFIGTIREKDHTPSGSRTFFAWAHTLWVVPDKFTLYHGNLDSYLYLRFLRTLIFLCVIGCAMTWPILIPVNATGGGTSLELDRISIGNVADKRKLYAHAIIAWVFFGFVMFTVARERLWLIGLRQAWFLSKPNANRLSSRVVLFLSAPMAALDQDNMQRFFGPEAVRVWPATKADKLQSLVSSRNSLVESLEAAELKLIQRVDRNRRKSTRAAHDNTISYNSLPYTLKKSFRPTHSPKTLPSGKKVDSIDYYREQIKEKEAGIEKARDSNATADSRNGAAAVFVEFQTQAAAQRAHQQVSAAEILALTPRQSGVVPGEVLWDNLTLPPARRISQAGMANALVIAIIIFWSIPISFVGAWSNVSYLAGTFKWLAWLNNLPDSVLALLSGLIPPILLSALSSWVPNIFRYIFRAFGEPTTTSAELKVLKFYFIFQVLQVFLVNTIASGAAAVVGQLATDPASIPILLAEQLPSAANSYLTYFIVQGLTSTSNNLLNYSDLLSYIFFDYFFDKTPRKKYTSFTSLKGVGWGKVFPKYGNFLIIAIVYSCIAPLVLGFAAVGLILFYVCYRYMFLFTVQPTIDTKGHSYTIALQYILIGVYIAELCLIGLFGLRSATGPMIIMVALLCGTVLFHALTNKYLAPLESFIPAEIASEAEDEDDEGAGLFSAAEEGEAGSHIQHLVSHARIPPKYTSPMARFFEPHIFASHRAMKAWLRSDVEYDEDDIPQYKDEQVRQAYLNPAYTSATPIVWIPRDRWGVSRSEVGKNEAEGLKSSDEGAWINDDGTLQWSSDDLEKVPIFSEYTRW